jgi:hypothetical protein
MSLSCPVCGSSDVAVATSQRSISAPLGPSVYAQLETDTCSSCGEQGDFERHNDEAIRAAEHQSAVASVTHLLEGLSHRGCSMAYMERALSLPTRTVTRWKAGEVGAAPMALLRIVATYPWMLEVADARFAPHIAASKVVVEAGKVLSGTIAAFAATPIRTYNVSPTSLGRSDETRGFSTNTVLQPMQLTATS